MMKIYIMANETETSLLFTVEETCVVCLENVKFGVTEKEAEELILRENGESSKSIQDIIPRVSADEREILVSKICGKCFDKLLG